MRPRELTLITTLPFMMTSTRNGCDVTDTEMSSVSLASRFEESCLVTVQLQRKREIADNLRYTREISEPAPIFSQHWAQIRGLRIFPAIKIIVVRQVHMSSASTAI